jgi:integrase
VLSKTRDPYEETQVSFLWDLVERSDNTQLKLMFAIGLECGLRSCELINIRIQDVDLKKQTIFVRLPTKNMQTRIVNFHKKVKHYLEMWLRMRPPEITTDHLFYTSKTTPATHQLHSWIRDFFRSKPEPAASFEFHRLRHTWATRLVNAGMELPILQQLGGWKSLKSVQIYAKVRKSTVDHQYEAAYAAIEAEVQQPKEKSCSLFDFALMPLAATTTPADSAR